MTSFAKIPQSEETMFGIMQQELDDVERSLQVLEESGMGGATAVCRKRLEKRQETCRQTSMSLKTRIEEKKDGGIDFHTMGIDHIFVDESHYFKNLMFQTRHTRVAGIGNNQGSQRAMNLLIAIRDIQERTGKGLGGYVPVGYGGRKCFDRIVRAFQVPAPERACQAACELL